MELAICVVQVVVRHDRTQHGGRCDPEQVDQYVGMEMDRGGCLSTALFARGHIFKPCEMEVVKRTRCSVEWMMLIDAHTKWWVATLVALKGLSIDGRMLVVDKLARVDYF
jgi:hypothetical protein